MFYLNKTEKFLRSNNYPIYENAILRNQWGDYYLWQRDLLNAENEYKKGAILAKKSTTTDEEIKAYQNLSKVYLLKGDQQKSKHYKEKYMSMKDSLNNALIKNLDTSINEIADIKKIQESQRINKYIWFSIIALCSSGLIIGVVQIKNRRKIKEKEILLKSKEELILQHEKSVEELEGKISTPIEEIIELAKKNNPLFYSKFLLANPNFQNNLLKINSDLNVSELTFCAYLFLGFQTKEIANYTFKSIKTIQNRKNSIRKRLNIPSSADINIWIQEHVV